MIMLLDEDEFPTAWDELLLAASALEDELLAASAEDDEPLTEELLED
jgi:hypothetical protein